jgi:hypothetical protein
MSSSDCHPKTTITETDDDSEDSDDFLYAPDDEKKPTRAYDKSSYESSH